MPADLLLGSLERFLRGEVDPAVAALDLQPLRPPPVDLAARLGALGLLDLESMDEETARPASLVGLVSAIAEHCAGVAAVVAYALAGDLARRRLGPRGTGIPGGLVAVALAEPGDVGLEDGRLRCATVLRDGAVTGRKRAVPLAPLAGTLAVACTAAESGEPCLAWVRAARVEVGPPLGLLGLRALPTADVVLAAAPVEAVSPLGPAELTTLLGTLGLLGAACACGTAAAALAAARRYARERRQGGRPIAEHDAVKLLLVENEAALGAARLALAAAAAGDADAGAPAADAEPWAERCLAARLPAVRAAVQATLDAIQVLGGYGYMRDYGLEKRCRDAVMLSLLPADNQRLGLYLAARRLART